MGKRDGFDDEDDLAEQVAELAGLLAEDFFSVEPRPRHTYLEVDREFAEDLIAAVDGETLGRKTIRVEFARQ